ncbi:MAG: pyruvate, phosphate dikinase [Candidatus Thorarchaeota archaeon]|nr:MAG: pyruvate, phosphate dikinase [Candidatus Thorarchaeota archaeon]RLI58691.1 MAG: pyruvate, phosphate dikinase [Candidatus Thorarchaeota archaeon]
MTGGKNKHVFVFGAGKADGNASMKNLLGGKGASLAGATLLGLPVPPGFTISTEVCNDYLESGGLRNELKEEAKKALKFVEETMGKKFGDPENPLLVSTRSGARQSMPGMMETVLNVGLTTSTIPGLIAVTKNERFVYDSYRRLITMFSDVVMEKGEGIEPEEGHGIRQELERILERKKKETGCATDTCLQVEDLKALCEEYKVQVKKTLGKEFPDDPYEQLWAAIGAVFKSWGGARAVAYRRIENIPDKWGTACTVQAMVFGNMGENSATGVAFSRNPATGENKFYGECLFNAQGEDVVAGIRTPNPMNEESKNDQNKDLPTLEERMPELYKQLVNIKNKLEDNVRDMVDLEFTIEEGKLFLVQHRVGKRTATAALRIAMEMLHDKVIDEPTAVLRVVPEQLGQLLYPILDPGAEKKATPIARGLPAGPGGAIGKIVFTSEDAVAWAKKEEDVVLIREETSPEDIEGMRAAHAVLTARGGMTSHAALVTRGWGKCCIVGATGLDIDTYNKTVVIKGKTYHEGDVLTLNGTQGLVYEGELPMIDATENPRLKEFMNLVDKYRRLGVRANAETPEDARVALGFGAEGIGLFRTEHMFYGEGSDEPLFLLRKMIVSKTHLERLHALSELEPFVKQDIKATLEVMDGLPVTIRLLDPPLHEFVPQSRIGQERLAHALGVDIEEIRKRGEQLHENNPMMGHRGVRLGITYPEIYEMQVRAILQAGAELIKEGKKVHIEIMIPVTIGAAELKTMELIVQKVYEQVKEEVGFDVPYLYGTMIEIPRACMRAGDMAQSAQFFSFGTNDLSQMGFGFSRDDIDSFLPEYLDRHILRNDPFVSIDKRGIGQLIQIAIERGRKTRPDIKLGVCGEHGGEPRSVEFFHEIGLDYVSCSPYRLPIARLAAAQAAIKEKRNK